MTEHWLFPIVLALVACVVVGAVATTAGRLRQRTGDRVANAASGAAMFFFLCYLVVGTIVAVYLALNPVVQNDHIEYDSREFTR